MRKKGLGTNAGLGNTLSEYKGTIQLSNAPEMAKNPASKNITDRNPETIEDYRRVAGGLASLTHKRLYYS